MKLQAYICISGRLKIQRDLSSRLKGLPFQGPKTCKKSSLKTAEKRFSPRNRFVVNFENNFVTFLYAFHPHLIFARFFSFLPLLNILRNLPYSCPTRDPSPLNPPLSCMATFNLNYCKYFLVGTATLSKQPLKVHAFRFFPNILWNDDVLASTSTPVQFNLNSYMSVLDKCSPS